MSKSLVFEVESYNDENSKFISRVIRAMSVIFLFQWPCVDLLPSFMLSFFICSSVGSHVSFSSFFWGK